MARASRIALLVALPAMLTCARGQTRIGYLHDPIARRAALEASLVVRDNDYARSRLAHYGRDWEALPIWNPRVARVGEAKMQSIEIGKEAAAGDPDALHALGEAAFFSYPAQLASVDEGAVSDLVHVELANGATGLAFTCASCHVRTLDDGRRIAGAANDRLDLGRLLAEADAERAHVPLDPIDPLVAPYLAWGPGRVDVTTGNGTEPVRIPDLRPTRFLTHLHHAGAVVQHDVTSLAIRIETQILVAHDAVLRPPREIALGLAHYVWSLSATLPEPPSGHLEARATFARVCSGCHGGEGLTGGLVGVERIGTDPAIACSFDRGTGAYRVPSLRGVGTRGALLHDASIPSLERMFDPARPGGHRFGLDLDERRRNQLVTFLRVL